MKDLGLGVTTVSADSSGRFRARPVAPSRRRQASSSESIIPETSCDVSEPGSRGNVPQFLVNSEQMINHRGTQHRCGSSLVSVSFRLLGPDGCSIDPAPRADGQRLLADLY